MNPSRRRRIRRIFLMLSLYGLLWAFLWGYLVVYTRSYNRLTHEPVVMAHLTLAPDRAQLSLADQQTTWTYPVSDEMAYFWLGTLPGVELRGALYIGQLLWAALEL